MKRPRFTIGSMMIAVVAGLFASFQVPFAAEMLTSAAITLVPILAAFSACFLFARPGHLKASRPDHRVWPSTSSRPA